MEENFCYLSKKKKRKKEESNNPKYLNRQVWPNSVDPNQTAQYRAVWSWSTLFAIPFASLVTRLYGKPHCDNFRIITADVWVSEFLRC